MRVGLVRHFPVEKALPTQWHTAAELQRWREDYERSQAIICPINVGVLPWPRCLSSDLERAVVTAQAAHKGTIEFTPLLREFEFDEFRTGALRLPPSLWKLVFRLVWMTGHRSQRHRRDDFKQRVAAVADMVEAGREDTLVVSHGGMMVYLGAELRRRGFSGPKLGLPKHAHLYEFRRPAAALDDAEASARTSEGNHAYENQSTHRGSFTAGLTRCLCRPAAA